MRKSLLLLAVMLSLGFSGCARYRVTDSDTGDVYYTNDIHKVRKSQRRPEITFTEKITGEKVTLQSPAVERIPRAEYKAEVAQIKREAAQQ
jgi:outer membrane lipoprotein SlyB